ncbi:TPA: hypothetical protein ACX6RX_003200 [Photobacterium damselae]
MSRIRNKGHSPLNDIIRKDWILSIRMSPDAFDALLYVPTIDNSSNGSDGYESSDFADLDTNQDTISYNTPIPVVIADCPDESEWFFTMNDGDIQLGEGEMPMCLRIDQDNVPIGSIVEWEEEVSTGDVRRCWWYIHSHQGFGTANVGSLYIAIPARHFDLDSVGIKHHD